MGLEIGNIQPLEKNCEGFEIPATKWTDKTCSTDIIANITNERTQLDVVEESGRRQAYQVILDYQDNHRLRIDISHTHMGRGMAITLLKPEEADDFYSSDQDHKWFDITPEVMSTPIDQSTTVFSLADENNDGTDDLVIHLQGGKTYMIPLEFTED